MPRQDLQDEDVSAAGASPGGRLARLASFLKQLVRRSSTSDSEEEVRGRDKEDDSAAEASPGGRFARLASFLKRLVRRSSTSDSEEEVRGRDREDESADELPPAGRWAAIRSFPKRVVGWSAAHRWKAAALGLACLVVLGGTVVLRLLLASSAPAEPKLNSDMVFRTLSQGNYAEAKQQAEQLRRQPQATAEMHCTAAFVLGAATAAEADQIWGGDKKAFYLLAARYLDEARQQGFPAGRQGEGTYLLGRCLALGQRHAACRPVLLSALELYPCKATEIHGLLARAYRHDANPMLPEALEETARYLSQPGLTDSQRHAGLLERAEILLELGRVAECSKTLDRIPQSAGNRDEVLVLRGRIQIEQARAAGKGPAERFQAQRQYQAALATLRAVRSSPTVTTMAAREAMYLVGICFLETGDRRAALTQFSRTAEEFPATPESLVSDLESADISRSFGHDPEAISAYRRVLTAVESRRNFSNPWIGFDALGKRILAAYHAYFEAEKYGCSLELAQHFQPLLPETQQVESLAESCRAWGHNMLAQCDRSPPEQANRLLHDGRERLRRAGVAFARLAALRVTAKEYPEDLWASGQCAMEGQNYLGAVDVFQQYLKTRTQDRNGRVLVDLGDACLALGRAHEAVHWFDECVRSHPRDAASYRARLGETRALSELGETARAEKLLQEVLDGDFLAPSSEEWREALFAMGHLLYGAGRYEEAARRFHEAVARYPQSPQSIEGLYLLGECHRRTAQKTQEKLVTELIEEGRLAGSKKIRYNLLLAIEAYRKVQQRLAERQAANDLSPLERVLFRNTYFTMGSAQVELGQYEAAVKTYATAISRYQNGPESLPAYLEQARIYRLLHKPDAARTVLSQAKLTLSHLKDDKRFTETTNYTRREWSELLDRS
jgi:tetratricopeptide (TPR) repeat protein